MILPFLGVMALSAVTAVPWALWAKFAADNHALRAAVSDMAILSLGGISILSYSTDHRLLPASVLGGGLGTFGTICRQRVAARRVSDVG